MGNNDDKKQQFVLSSDDSDDQEYLNNTKPALSDIKLEIRSKIIPRYSCANHKLNLAIRKSIKENPQVEQLFKDLSKYASKSKKKLEISRLMRRKKSKLRTNNKIRWGSGFLMLSTFIKAIQNGIIF